MQPVSPGGGPVTDPYLNYDAYEPWVHGYWQELPAFGGYAYFRPYNYRHVYVQSEVATSWQTSAQMPYSQEYYRRAREQGLYEQRTTSTSRTGLPFVYRQKPRTTRQPEIIAKASAERPQPQKPAAAPSKFQPIIISSYRDMYRNSRDSERANSYRFSRPAGRATNTRTCSARKAPSGRKIRTTRTRFMSGGISTVAANSR